MARTTVYNEIVTDKKWEEVNSDNKFLLDEFIEYLQATDKSPATITNYISDIKIHFCWLLDNCNNKKFIDLKRREVMKYQNYLLNTLNLGSARIRRLRASISSLSNFIENILGEEDEFKNFRNIINKIEPPQKVARREKSVFTDDEIKFLLDTLVEKKEYQKACLIALACFSGCRRSELLRFKVDYFKDEYIMYGSLYKTPEKIKTKGRSSQGKLLYKYTLAKEFKPYLDLWLAERERLGINNEYLFVLKKKDKYVVLPNSTLSYWCETFTKILGKDFYLHSLRHFFTTSLASHNIPDNVIKDIVGWSSLDLVSVYNDTESDDEFGKYFGEDGIKKVDKSTLADL